jgi:hypothetical protein
MLEGLPGPAFYRPDNPRKYRRPDGQTSRNVMGLNDEALERLPDATRPLWSGIAMAMSSTEIKDKVFDLLSADLCRRFRTDAAGLRLVPAYPRPGLVRDLGGYRIEPHPDTQSKIVTMQFYLARDSSQIDLGTALYRLRLWKWRNLVSPSGVLEKFKQFEFRPNSGYGFAVGRTSWHGRDEVPEASGVRHSLMHLYYRDSDKGW